MLDFRMDTFLAVCEHMNYTRAAESLCITQPAVSQQIHMLEEYYQMKLFEYEGKSLRLTAEGEVLKQATLCAKHDEKHLVEKMHRVRQKRHNVKFGATLTVGEFLLPKRLAKFIEQETDCDINMQVANTHELLEKLNQGEIDFAIVEGYFEKANYESRIFSTENYICVKGRDYDWKEPPSVFADVLTNPIVVREVGSGTREILERFLQEKNYSMSDFKKIIETNNMHAIKQLVASGCGITFLYQIAVEEELETGILEKVDLKDFEVSHEFTFIWQKNSIFQKEYEMMYKRFQENGVS
jgi:DNA-binding transcriptional LysR family regulator